MGQLEAAVPRDVLSASQKKGTGLLNRHVGSNTEKTMGLGGAVGMCICICFVHTSINTHCPKDINKGKATPVQA